MSQPTHYEVLSLPRSLLDDTSSPDQSAQILKRAYHRALLRHHPDKATTASATTPSLPTPTPTSSSSALPPPPRPRHQDPLVATTTTNSSGNKTTTTTTTTTYTIDQIITAYTTLSTPSSKKSYDQSLRTSNRLGGGGNNGDRDATTATTFQTGIETIDLDDLSTAEDETSSRASWWWKACRCGNPQGFRFGEADLEEAGDLGELIVGCQDCSLWLRVHFAMVEEDDRARTC